MKTHYYTVDAIDRDGKLAPDYYVDEGVCCFVFPQSADGLMPLYRLFNPQLLTFFLTMNVAERDNAVNILKYQGPETICYCYPYVDGQPLSDGAIPLYRSYNKDSDDHFYTTDKLEHDFYLHDLKYVDEGIAAGVLSPGTNPIVVRNVIKLWRLFGQYSIIM